MKNTEVVVLVEEQRVRLRREVDNAFDMLLGAIAGTPMEPSVEERCAAVATAQYGTPACRCEREAGHAGHHKHSAWHWAATGGPFAPGDARNEEILRKDLAYTIARAEQAEARADAIDERAKAYERDWHAAKSEFGTATSKLREEVRDAAGRAEKAEAERNKARRDAFDDHVTLTLRAETAECELAEARAEVARLTAQPEPKGRATDASPCAACHGHGRIYRPDDALNDDDGGTCRACGGTGLERTDAELCEQAMSVGLAECDRLRAMNVRLIRRTNKQEQTLGAIALVMSTPAEQRHSAGSVGQAHLESTLARLAGLEVSRG